MLEKVPAGWTIDKIFQDRDIMAQTIEQKVLAAMKKAKEPVKSGDIAKVTGIDGKEITKAINTLKKEGKIVSPKRCYYEPA